MVVNAAIEAIPPKSREWHKNWQKPQTIRLLPTYRRAIVVANSSKTGNLAPLENSR
jgi:hypothetical protein